MFDVTWESITEDVPYLKDYLEQLIILISKKIMVGIAYFLDNSDDLMSYL